MRRLFLLLTVLLICEVAFGQNPTWLCGQDYVGTWGHHTSWNEITGELPNPPTNYPPADDLPLGYANRGVQDQFGCSIWKAMDAAVPFQSGTQNFDAKDRYLIGSTTQFDHGGALTGTNQVKVFDFRTGTAVCSLPSSVYNWGRVDTVRDVTDKWGGANDQDLLYFADPRITSAGTVTYPTRIFRLNIKLCDPANGGTGTVANAGGALDLNSPYVELWDTVYDPDSPDGANQPLSRRSSGMDFGQGGSMSVGGGYITIGVGGGSLSINPHLYKIGTKNHGTVISSPEWARSRTSSEACYNATSLNISSISMDGNGNGTLVLQSAPNPAWSVGTIFKPQNAGAFTASGLTYNVTTVVSPTQYTFHSDGGATTVSTGTIPVSALVLATLASPRPNYRANWMIWVYDSPYSEFNISGTSSSSNRTFAVLDSTHITYPVSSCPVASDTTPMLLEFGFRSMMMSPGLEGSVYMTDAFNWSTTRKYHADTGTNALVYDDSVPNVDGHGATVNYGGIDYKLQQVPGGVDPDLPGCDKGVEIVELSTAQHTKRCLTPTVNGEFYSTSTAGLGWVMATSINDFTAQPPINLVPVTANVTSWTPVASLACSGAGVATMTLNSAPSPIWEAGQYINVRNASPSEFNTTVGSWMLPISSVSGDGKTITYTLKYPYGTLHDGYGSCSPSGFTALTTATGTIEAFASRKAVMADLTEPPSVATTPGGAAATGLTVNDANIPGAECAPANGGGSNYSYCLYEYQTDGGVWAGSHWHNETTQTAPPKAAISGSSCYGKSYTYNGKTYGNCWNMGLYGGYQTPVYTQNEVYAIFFDGVKPMRHMAFHKGLSVEYKYGFEYGYGAIAPFTSLPHVGCSWSGKYCWWWGTWGDRPKVSTYMMQVTGDAEAPPATKSRRGGIWRGGKW